MDFSIYQKTEIILCAQRKLPQIQSSIRIKAQSAQIFEKKKIFKGLQKMVVE